MSIKTRHTYYHECEICGCNLDPGEGCICDDCKHEFEIEKQKEKAQSQVKRIRIVDDESVSKYKDELG